MDGAGGTQEADTQAAGTQPADTQAADNQAVVTQMADSQTGDHQAADTQPAGIQAADNEAADNEAADTQAADTEAADTQAADTQPEDSEAADNQAAGTQPADSQAETNQAVLYGNSAEDFIKLYFKLFDQCRSQIEELYEDNALVIIEGTYTYGKEEIMSHFLETPNSIHKLNDIDATPVPSKSRETTLVAISGEVRFESEPAAKAFYHIIYLEKQNGKWQISTQVCSFPSTQI